MTLILVLTVSSVSFKKKKRPNPGLSLPRFLSLSNAKPQQYPSLPLPTARSRKLRETSSNNNSEISLTLGNSQFGEGSSLNDTKDGGPLDWYLEGPGRRVGYDDLTAIDWIFEYTKERKRLSVLYYKTAGLLGYARQLFDASQIWLILIGAGLASGIFAAGIDVASDWLGDLKTGYCRNGAGGGKFYLNKGFCCWGLEGKTDQDCRSA